MVYYEQRILEETGRSQKGMTAFAQKEELSAERKNDLQLNGFML